MKLFALILSVAFAVAALGSVWTTQADLDGPESAYFDPVSGFLFVSNVSGGPADKDGKGWIQKLTPDGKVVASRWVSGLNSPKGMRAKNGILYVADIDVIHAINIQSGASVGVVKIPGAQLLNDIAISESSDIYVSDTLGRKIYRVRADATEIFFDGDETESPNGLIINGGKLIVAAWGLTDSTWATKIPGRLYSIDLATRVKTLITPEPLGNLDGVEIANDGSYLVSDWLAGKVYRITASGEATIVLDAKAAGVADIGYISKTNTLLVPHMISNKVEAVVLN